VLHEKTVCESTTVIAVDGETDDVSKWIVLQDTGNIFCAKSNIGVTGNYRGLLLGVHYINQMLLSTLETDRERMDNISRYVNLHHISRRHQILSKLEQHHGFYHELCWGRTTVTSLTSSVCVL
jgi:hypothetical protein